MNAAVVSPDDSDSLSLRCARHPSVETVLRCGRCDTPICPRCAISTPVGSRCPTCAQVKRFAILLKPRELARAVAYGLGAAVAGTVVFSFVPFLGPLISFALIGFGVGEAASVGANRKRVRELAPIAVACLFLGFAVAIIGLQLVAGEPFGVRLLLVPVNVLRAPLLLLGLLVGALLAWMRAR